MNITADLVKTVRERTNAGIMDCKKALEEAKGDIEKAIEILRKQSIAAGIALSEKRSDKQPSQGLVECYIHAGGRIAAMVEVNCETDFVARTDVFKELAHTLAMQVAAMSPRFVGYDVPEKLDGKLEEVSLLHQLYIRDPSKTVKDLVAEATAKVGEKVIVRRFARFELGEQ